MPSWSINKLRAGFTLVEVAIVIPIAILIVIALIAIMVSVSGDSLTTNAQVEMSYDLSSAFDRVEQDTRRSGAFETSFGDGTISPQGKNNDGTAFSASGGDLILAASATTTNPMLPDRGLVFFTNQPNACNDDKVIENSVLAVHVVYFLKASGSTSTLWRRTVVDPYNQNVTPDSQTVCAKPWQRNSCAPSITGARCETQDEQILDNISSLTTTYIKSNGINTANPAEATSIKLEITLSRTVAGQVTTKTMVLRADRMNIGG